MVKFINSNGELAVIYRCLIYHFKTNVTEFEYYEYPIREGNSLKFTFVVKYMGNRSYCESDVSFRLNLCSTACSFCNITASISVGKCYFCK